MKRRFSLIAVLVVVLALSTGMFTAYAVHNDDVDLTGKWYLWLSPTEYCFLSIFNTNVNGYPVLVLKQDGDKLSGNIKGANYGRGH